MTTILADRNAHGDLTGVVAAERGDPELTAGTGPVDGLGERVLAAGLMLEFKQYSSRR